jgi:hypothetical protein
LKTEPEEIPDADHELIIERVAAIDVAKASGKVCLRLPRPGRAGHRVSRVWDVEATTAAVCELADHLVAGQVERVTVESTSDYWRIWYYLLEAAGLSVQLVNARDVKNGHLTKADYETVLIPDIEDKLKRHKKLRYYTETCGAGGSSGCDRILLPRRVIRVAPTAAAATRRTPGHAGRGGRGPRRRRRWLRFGIALDDCPVVARPTVHRQALFVCPPDQKPAAGSRRAGRRSAVCHRDATAPDPLRRQAITRTGRR